MTEKRWGAGDVGEAAMLAVTGYQAFACYEVAGRLAALRGTDFGPRLHTFLDDVVPYCSIFAVPYALAYVMPLLVAIHVGARGGLPAFRRAFFGYLGLLAFHLAFYVAFPSSARAVMLAPDAVAAGALARGVDFFYGIAPPWCAFPSFHVAGCWFFYRVLAAGSPGLGKAYLAWFWTMVVSTLALKIHWALDGVAGLAVAEAFYRWAYVPLEAREACAWTWESAAARAAALCAPIALLGVALAAAAQRFGSLFSR